MVATIMPIASKFPRTGCNQRHAPVGSISDGGPSALFARWGAGMRHYTRARSVLEGLKIRMITYAKDRQCVDFSGTGDAPRLHSICSVVGVESADFLDCAAPLSYVRFRFSKLGYLVAARV